MKACIVVPTIREKNAQDFLHAWRMEFSGHHVIVVEDNPERTFKLPSWYGAATEWRDGVTHLTHVSWKEIDADLKDDAWIIPRRSGAIRNYGNLLASRIPGLDMIVNLDDDCMPDELPFLEAHWKALETPGMTATIFDTMGYLCTAPNVVGLSHMRPRGFPKKIRLARTVLNHGLWNGVPDLDGETQLKYGDGPVTFLPQLRQVPVGTLFPMSAMNIAFRPELLPAMYNLPMGQGQPFHRFDDIWCGLIMKKACDAMGWSVRSGSPCIRHIRASDAKRNAELEAPGIVENEEVWRHAAECVVSGNSLTAALQDIHLELSQTRGEYWRMASRAAGGWRRLIKSNRPDRLPT
jgi:hypothetical protein